jgi:7-carboxy-7-deazaguanine synthase
MVFRLSELYTSIQGEGPNVGTPTVFTRFGGCNLRCAGWACDTPYAIFPKYRNEWRRISWLDLYDEIIKQPAQNVCLTGGEPFLQPRSALAELTTHLVTARKTVEAFSNGTILYPDWAVDNVTFTMDWKLPGSGEDMSNPIRLMNLNRLASSPKPQAIKFVVKDIDDFYTAMGLWGQYVKGKTNITTYAGRVWSDDPERLTDAQLAEWIITHQMPWKLNVQMQNHIWNRSQRGI